MADLSFFDEKTAGTHMLIARKNVRQVASNYRFLQDHSFYLWDHEKMERVIKKKKMIHNIHKQRKSLNNIINQLLLLLLLIIISIIIIKHQRNPKSRNPKPKIFSFKVNE